MASTDEATGLVMAAPGGFQQLTQKSWALPACGEGELRVQIEHVALNFADLLICEGTYQVRPEPPFSPGLEVAGRVVSSGHPLSGARVVGLLDHGGLATFANIHERHLVKIPDDVSNQQPFACLSATEPRRQAYLLGHGQCQVKPSSSTGPPQGLAKPPPNLPGRQVAGWFSRQAARRAKKCSKP